MGMMTIGNGMKIDLLWENPNPKNSFSPQTIQLPNFTDYDILRVYAYAGTASTIVSVAETFSKIGDRALMSYVGWDSQAVTHDRSATVTETGLSVTGGSRAGVSNNTVMIPYRIYGIKF